ncbi:PepSY domain-containing protein [Cereibacter azotoformans]|uniref:PepSY domain-containing protein n=1 Tax=Cereibacter azotoformans TaxID=43057 RepID=UPI001EEA55D1|nr:PepSY domain-containing protein [Cereibacter azotoformans]ULB10075.1 PepSY domain-containing protein [Cereibacter azotoformans]
MRKLAALALVLAATTASAQEADEATVERINALLAEMQCEVDPVNIEADDGGWDLDDVFCADGQYDIKLDANFEVTEKRKE